MKDNVIIPDIIPDDFKQYYQEEYFLMVVLKDHCFMPYSYWRHFVAPFRSNQRHEQYYPSMNQYLEYYYACKADGYKPYGNNDERKSYINLLNLLRRQRGLRPLTASEVKQTLDMGHHPCYT